MNLKSFGCSFIFGSELSDVGVNDFYANGSKLTWPAHLARHFELDYYCYARPGAGNLQITEQVLGQLACNEHALYVIGWTWIDRFDYINKTNNYWPGNHWNTITPATNDKLSETYYKHLHSEYQDKLTTLLYIRTVIETLKQKNYPFIMTYIDNLLFDRQWHTTPVIVALQEYIKPHMIQFDGLNFLEWSQQNGFPIGQENHPLAAAHQVAGDYMIEIFNKQNIL
jgi:hypothetical protein